MNIRNYVPTLALAGLGALAIFVAPAAAATQNGAGGTSAPGVTQTSPNSTLYQTNGSSQLFASPPTVSPPQSLRYGLYYRR
jgi:hypothetical protein